VVVSTNYRMLPLADPLEQARDVGRALAAVQARAAGWGADGRQIVLMGHSSGGHL
jgi:acetyl esterase/lipase